MIRRAAGWLLRLLAGVGMLVLAHLASCAVLGAQALEPVIRVAPAVSDSLARAWDDTTPGQPERGYCVRDSVAAEPYGGTAVLLTALVPPDTTWGATPYTIGFRCPARTLPLHTHTPTTCPLLTPWDHDLAHCRIGGPDAWLCEPSERDRLSLTAASLPWGFVQCDRRALVPYTPYHLTSPP